ncbi:MAG: putative glycoside hydrolase [Patescibacteria group bacterium]|jgi:hypothetical protein
MLVTLVNLLTLTSILFFSFVLALNNSSYQVVSKPEKIESKGIYLTAYTAGSKSRRQELVDLIEKTELNSVVIDIKDYSGKIFFETAIPLADEIKSEEVRIPDLAEWLKELKQKGIYTIARIAVFQDPYLAEKRPDIALKTAGGGIWHDFKGLSWVDPTQKLVWDYNLDLAKAAAEIGFDEVNFDYIRFPSDGNIKQIVYANLDNATYEGKAKAMADFYQYVHQTLRFYPIITSADLFGMVLWRSDGLNIGQRFEDAINNFDYICPMVYPSHYPAGFEKFANPAEHPYEVIYRSLIRVKDKFEASQTKLRPWLQAFDLGTKYTPEMIRTQIRASDEAGGNGWFLWNASNRYTGGGLKAK